MEAGDILIALPSSGLHSNGYSLARKLFFEVLKMRPQEKIGETPLIDLLLKPTTIYVKAFKAYREKINALAHITGGGIVENLPRSLPQGLKAVVQKEAIRIPEIFRFMSKHVDEAEMFRTFNMGVGMVLVTRGTGGYVIGQVELGETRVEMV